MIVDIREECEFSRFHLKGSMLVPRGILESACEDEYEDAIPDLVNGRDEEIIVICRSVALALGACWAHRCCR